MYVYRMDDLTEFLRTRNVPEETIEALEQEKVRNWTKMLHRCNSAGEGFRIILYI